MSYCLAVDPVDRSKGVDYVSILDFDYGSAVDGEADHSGSEVQSGGDRESDAHVVLMFEIRGLRA